MIEFLKLKLDYIRSRLNENTCSMLIWLIDFCPRLGGFPLRIDRTSAVFMITHISLLFYACVVGTVDYLIYVADSFYESVISFFNVFIIGVIMNNTLLFLCKKKDLRELLSLVLKNDSLLIDSDRFVDDYRKLVKKIKNTIIALHIFSFVNAVLIYIPSRIFSMENFAVTSCVGLDLTSSPSLEICMLILVTQEVTGLTVVLAYDATILLMFLHTTAVYQILYQDMDSFKEIRENMAACPETTSFISEKLKNIVVRHSALLRTVEKIQNIFSVSIGYGFAQNALSLCLFFALPLNVSLSFGPLIYYTLVVFFCYCHCGQKLTDTAEKFEMAVYTCGWENFHLKDQKSVLLILKQAQKKVVLKAANTVPICIYTFANGLQFIYKFVTMFKVQHENDL